MKGEGPLEAPFVPYEGHLWLDCTKRKEQVSLYLFVGAMMGFMVPLMGMVMLIDFVWIHPKDNWNALYLFLGVFLASTLLLSWPVWFIPKRVGISRQGVRLELPFRKREVYWNDIEYVHVDKEADSFLVTRKGKRVRMRGLDEVSARAIETVHANAV